MYNEIIWFSQDWNEHKGTKTIFFVNHNEIPVVKNPFTEKMYVTSNLINQNFCLTEVGNLIRFLVNSNIPTDDLTEIKITGT